MKNTLDLIFLYIINNKLYTFSIFVSRGLKKRGRGECKKRNNWKKTGRVECKKRNNWKNTGRGECQKRNERYRGCKKRNNWKKRGRGQCKQGIIYETVVVTTMVRNSTLLQGTLTCLFAWTSSRIIIIVVVQAAAAVGVVLQ